MAVESSFKIGDKVRVKDSAWEEYNSNMSLKSFGFKKDGEYEVSGFYNNGLAISLKGCYSSYYSKYFEHSAVKVNEDIARPILEERKIGKVQMDLFDSGFPNAITEVAKVMTWAALNKGYKPHDWKSLPNAETEFSAAASRHRVKGFIQKAEGVAAIDRTDEESNIVHLAHTAFNILAELELVLTGKIK